jgi:hypothetical protein
VIRQQIANMADGILRNEANLLSDSQALDCETKPIREEPGLAGWRRFLRNEANSGLVA